MGSPVIIFSGALGLNTVVDPVRVSYDPETGVSDLGVAINIRLDDTGRPGRVDGFSSVEPGEFHSLFCDGGDCFVGKDTALYQVAGDLTTTGIRSGLSGDRISYTQAVDKTYYSNGLQNGILKDGISTPWVKDEYLGPDTSKYLTAAPIGHHLATAFSRIFIAEDDVLWWSEAFRYGLYNQAINFVRFPSKILMVKPVASGLFVSDRSKTYFLSGTDPHSFIQRMVATYPAHEWSDAIDYVEGMDIGLEPGLCAMWTSPEGAVLGTPSGQLININKSKIIYPENCQSGASLLRGYNFIHTIT